MNQQLNNFYKDQIFSCTKCQQRLLNPYLHHNPKHDPPEPHQHARNRRQFQLSYIASKQDVRIVIVGEAPGLDGCGYGGIAFTGEHDAVHRLGLPNYHGTQGIMQREQSANLIYQAMASYARTRKITTSRVASQIYLTNAVMCVPLASNGKSIAAPTAGTRKQCRGNLVKQLEIINPRAVVTLGANGLKSVTAAFNVKLPGKLTDIVITQRQQGATRVGDFDLVAELHPSPRNRVQGQLYTDLPKSLERIFNHYIT